MSLVPHKKIDGPDITFVFGTLLAFLYIAVHYFWDINFEVNPEAIESEMAGKAIAETAVLFSVFVFWCCAAAFRISSFFKDGLKYKNIYVFCKESIETLSPIALLFVIYIALRG